MSETETEKQPYKYARTFEVPKMEKPLADMDRDALRAYIKEILGANTSEKEADAV